MDAKSKFVAETADAVSEKVLEALKAEGAIPIHLCYDLADIIQFAVPSMDYESIKELATALDPSV